LKHLHLARHQKRTHVSRRILSSQPADIGDAETQLRKNVQHPSIYVQEEYFSGKLYVYTLEKC